ALADMAVRQGGRVLVLCAAETTLVPTRALFEAAASTHPVELQIRLVPDAWAIFKQGETDRYLAMIAEAADAGFRAGAGGVALAQASMAGAVAPCRDGRPLPPPGAGLAAAAAAVRSHRRSSPIGGPVRDAP